MVHAAELGAAPAGTSSLATAGTTDTPSPASARAIPVSRRLPEPGMIMGQLLRRARIQSFTPSIWVSRFRENHRPVALVLITFSRAREGPTIVRIARGESRQTPDASV